jgi:hypothetical protein
MKVVVHDKACPSGKRRFETVREADRALGRAQHKRKRFWEDQTGSLRGLVSERRYYDDCTLCDGIHLTHLDKRQLIPA